MNRIISLKQINFKDNKNGFYSISTRHGDMIVNEMGNICCYDFEHLCSCVKQQFNLDDIDANKKTKNFLFELRNIGLIDFESEEDTPLTNDSMVVAGEATYKKISEDIVNFLDSDKTIYSVSKDKKYYNIYPLRTRSFSNKENYFFKIKNGKFSIIGVQNLDAPKVPAFISLLKYGEDVDDLIELFDELLVELKRLRQFKIRITTSLVSNSPLLQKILLQEEFELEGVLKKEDGINDYYLYGKII